MASTAISVKFGDIIRQYDGQGDFSEWLRKLELVAELQGVTNVEKFLPLFLSGGAFSVYESLEDDVRKDFAKLKMALVNAFSLNAYSAYETFVSRRYITGEPIDVYLSELRRLARLVSTATDEAWIKCAFISGLPDDLKRQLKSATSLDSITLAAVVERARTLTNVDQDLCGAVGFHTDKVNKAAWKETRICHNCQKPGHLARFCRQDRKEHRTRANCIFCGDTGHFMAACPVRSAEVPKNE